MNKIIESNLLTLQKSGILLNNLSNEQLSNSSIPPYYSSIGSHIRHIYDFYYCLLNKNDNLIVDLTSRRRSLRVETCCDSAIDYLNDIEEKIKILKVNSTDSITVLDDLGNGKIEIEYTYAALFSQANSHAIHHYAIIGYLLDRLNIKINDKDFGYNPSTPKKVLKIN